jgi:membrane protease YdiL (CAAX protease family)
VNDSVVSGKASRADIWAVGVFLVLAFTWSWAWAWPLALSGAVVTRGDGWPTHFPALLGPAAAALLTAAWIGGRAGVRDLLARMGRWRFPLRWWAVTLSPLAFLVVALLVQAALGDTPAPGDFGRYTGLPAAGVLGVIVLVVVLNGFGEETGWRGFAVPTLLPRFGPLGTALIIAPVWALWHLPYFFLLDSYQSFNLLTIIGFPVGLAYGSIVLTWLYLGTGGSILAVAIWHGLFNMATATDGATNIIASTVSAPRDRAGHRRIAAAAANAHSLDCGDTSTQALTDR